MDLEELWHSIDETHGVAEFHAYLLEGGDPFGTHGESRSSLLHQACAQENLTLIRELVERGLPINARDKWGQTPLHIAVDIDIDSVNVRLGDVSEMSFTTTRLLLSLGADPSVQDGNGLTPREWAAKYGPDVLEQFDRRTSQTM
jgi:ankyrin repeat protein